MPLIKHGVQPASISFAASWEMDNMTAEGGDFRMYDKLKTVLVVEDADDQREILKAFIESLGLHVLTAADGLIATDILQTKRIDLLITDFRMPNMDGASLLRWCRLRSFDMPVIFLSSEAHLFTHEELALKDCCSLLMKSKPMSLDLIKAAIHAADGHSRDACPFKSFKAAFREALADSEIPSSMRAAIRSVE